MADVLPNCFVWSETFWLILGHRKKLNVSRLYEVLHILRIYLFLWLFLKSWELRQCYWEKLLVVLWISKLKCAVAAASEFWDLKSSGEVLGVALWWWETPSRSILQSCSTYIGSLGTQDLHVGFMCVLLLTCYVFISRLMDIKMWNATFRGLGYFFKYRRLLPTFRLKNLGANWNLNIEEKSAKV